MDATIPGVRAGGRSRRRRGRSGLGSLALVAASLLAAGLGAEALLRAFPALIPAGVYGAGRYDPALGMQVRAGDVLYTRSGVVRKRANADGFLDVDHAAAKPPGSFRVGFFGDSYVEANQVPTEAAFFRLLPPLLAPRDVESFGFGLSGWGTLQALRAFRTLGPRYGLDLAVYVFVENDPGDNALELSAHRHDAAMPYATLAPEPPGYRVVEAEPPSDPLWFRAAKALQRRSLLAQVVWVRFRLLRQEGLRPRARAEERAMRERAPRAPGAKPDPNDLPSSWSREERDAVLLLTERILADWKRAADEQGTAFAVLYVPRGDDMLTGVMREEDSWYPWLRDTCARLEILLLDPRAELAARVASGTPVYDDHFTRDGHETIARFLAERLQPLLPTAPPP
jgi:hypothetical protein